MPVYIPIFSWHTNGQEEEDWNRHCNTTLKLRSDRPIKGRFVHQLLIQQSLVICEIAGSEERLKGTSLITALIRRTVTSTTQHVFRSLSVESWRLQPDWHTNAKSLADKPEVTSTSKSWRKKALASQSEANAFPPLRILFTLAYCWPMWDEKRIRSMMPRKSFWELSQQP